MTDRAVEGHPDVRDVLDGLPGDRAVGRAASPVPGPLVVGRHEVWPPVVLAPMAGVTDRDFRLIVRRIGGVGLVSMEFISSKAIVNGNRRTFDLMHFTDEERMDLCFQVATFVGYGRMGSALAMTDDLPEEYAEADAVLAPWRQAPASVV